MTSVYTKQKSIPNFIVLLFIASLLVIDFLPYFNTVEIINPQFLYLSLLNVIIGIYFYFNSERIAADAILDFKKNYVVRIYAVFLFLCGITFITAKNTSLVLTKITELVIVFCLFVNLCILLKGKLDLFYKIVFIICISAFLQSWLQIKNFLILPKNIPIELLLNNMKGNTGNINILAASLTIKVPFLLLGITYFSSFKKWFLLFVLFSVVSVILLTGARTALINLFLISIIYAFYLLKENSFRKPGFLKTIVIVIPILIAILFTSSIFEKSKNNARYVSLENRVQQINTEDASAQARLDFWRNAIIMISKNPILGIGLGNYQIESIPYERLIENDFEASLHAHNDFLEISTETGILNGLIYLSLFVFVFITNVKRIIKSKLAETKAIATLTLLLVIVYGIDSLFNFPMYRATMQIFFALLLALTVTNSENNKDFFANSSNYKVVYIILIFTAFLTSYSAFLIFKASNLEYLIRQDDINFNNKGALTGDEVIKRMPKYPNVFNTAESFYEYAGIYYIREKNYEKALNCFSKASKINPYFGRIDYYKYVISQAKGNIDSAYTYSKNAFYLRPKSSHLYKASLFMASVKKDTLEIIQEHKLFSKYTKSPEAWTMAVTGLERSGVDQKRLIKFIDQGLKALPKDSTLLKRKKDFLITQYIIEGQNYLAQSSAAKALDTYQKALKIDPENSYVMQNIGFYYFNSGKYNQAIIYFSKALKHEDLNDGKTEFFLAFSYLQNKDKVNACKYLNISKGKGFAGAEQQLKQYCK